jgi:hypothetical protein
MQKIICYSLILALFVGCKPEQIVLDPVVNPFEVFPIHFRQNILIEQFVSETNSGTIEASYQTQNWKHNFPNQIIPVSIHANDWLTIDYSEYLSTFYGGLSQVPSAAINRQLGINSVVSTTDSLTLINIDNYAKTIQKELDKTPPLTISLSSTLTNNKKGNLDVYLAFNETIKQDTRIGIYLVEDQVKAYAQAGATGDFLQQEVLRQMITDYQGDTITLVNNSIYGTIAKRSYSNIDLTNYDLLKMKFVVFVYSYNPNFKKSHIINAQTVRMGGNRYWD